MKKIIMITMSLMALILFSGCDSYYFETNQTKNNFECNVYCNEFEESWSCEIQNNNFKEFEKVNTCSCEFYNCFFEVWKKDRIE